MPVTTDTKIKVAVLYGGRSSEHAISLQSAAAIIKNLDRSRFEVIPIFIDRHGHWRIEDGQGAMDTYLLGKSLLSPDSILQVETFCKKNPNFCDVVFPVLHGTYGEDGTLQGLLAFFDRPYVGADTLGSAVGMDKVLSKRLVAESGIPIVPFIDVNQGQWQLDAAHYAHKIQQTLGYPVFVKPVNAGSSVGVSRVQTPEELAVAMETAFIYDNKVLIEKALSVREIEIAVLENAQWGRPPRCSVVGEIVPRHAFYSYEAKYIDPDGATLVIPAALSAKQVTQLQDFAPRIFDALACQGMARIDFFIDQSTQAIYFNEINTIPGFTQISMYPKLWEASGMKFTDLLSALIDLALARHARQAKLQRIYSPQK